MKISANSRVSKNLVDNRKQTKIDFKKKTLFDNHKRQIIRPEVSKAYTSKFNQTAISERAQDTTGQLMPGEKVMRAPAKTAPKDKFMPFKKDKPKKKAK